MDILKKNEDGTYVVRFEKRGENFGVTKVTNAHDYLRLTKQISVSSLFGITGGDGKGWYIQNESGKNVYVNKDCITVDVDMSSKHTKFLAELLSNHKHAQDEHFNTGNYDYQQGVLRFYEDGEVKYSILIPGEREPIIAGQSLYNLLKKKGVI